MKKKTDWNKIGVYTVLIIFSILFLLPFVWTLTTSIKPESEIFTYPPKLLPSTPKWENFKNAWTSQPFGLFLKNSLVVVLLSTIGQVISSSLVAYGFARFDFKGRDILFMILLSTMMIPWDVTMIPQYMQFNALGWINTLKPLIVPSWFGAPFYIFMLRQFMMSIPKELEEAAIIDGANRLQIFTKIFVPLCIPSFVLVGVFNILSAWNDYLGPLIFLNDQSKYTIPLGLAQFKGMHGADIPAIMAITTIVTIPPLIIFFFAQKSLVEGVSNTGLKG